MSYFDQLTQREQERIWDAYQALTAELGKDLRIADDDTAGRVVDAIARGILETRQADAARPPSEREKFAAFLGRILK